MDRLVADSDHYSSGTNYPIQDQQSLDSHCPLTSIMKLNHVLLALVSLAFQPFFAMPSAIPPGNESGLANVTMPTDLVTINMDSLIYGPRKDPRPDDCRPINKACTCCWLSYIWPLSDFRKPPKVCHEQDCGKDWCCCPCKPFSMKIDH